jgi:hypothetical protein
MAELKTKPTASSVESFLKGVADETKRRDALALAALMQKATKAEPKMWGPSIVGFGSYHYKYASGHEGDSCVVGFSPRKDSLTVYLPLGSDRYGDLLAKLGKHKTGKGCLYIKTLDDVHLPTLEKLIRQSFKDRVKANP